MRLRVPEDLSALDELLLKGDAWPTTRPVMTLALVLSEPPTARHLEAAFLRAIAAVPRMGQRIARSAWAAGRPMWVVDKDFDLSYHLRRIGSPGDGSLDAALAWASAGTTAPFDPARPLWDAVLVERLAEGGAVVIIRAHHAIADGVRAIQMMASLLDFEPSPDRTSPTGDDGNGPDRVLPPSAAQVLRAVERLWVTNPLRTSALARSGYVAGLHPIRTAIQATSYVRSAMRTVDRGDADPLPLLAGRSGSRHFATIEVPLASMKAVAAAHGVTVNDVYLSALLGGMRRYQRAFGLSPADVAVALPIDVGGGVEHQAGNHVSAAVFPGPASVADPVARLHEVHDLVASRRTEPGLRALDHLAPTLRQLPARLAIAAMGVHARRVDLQASNLVGPPFPLYLAGEQVERLYAFGPLPGVPVMAVLVSYNGLCTVGFTLDPAAVTDQELFVSSVRDAFDELLGLADETQ